MLAHPRLALLAALLLSASTWFYVDHILVPYQIGDAVTHDRPRGNLSDLYPRWLGARELLLHDRDPYSAAVTREIQIGYYGRALNAANPDDPQDQQGFAYPVYVVFLIAPAVGLDFHVVQEGFNAFLWILTGASVLLWMKALRWRPSRYMTAVLIVLTLGSLPAVQGIKLQQLSLLVAGLLSGCAAAVAGGYLVLAGILLALSTIKPQLAWLPALWLLLWAAHDWRRRQRLVWAFTGTMLALLGAAQIILPGWLGRFYVAVQKYHEYTHNVSVLGWLFTPTAGNVLAAVLLLVSAVQCRRFLNEPHTSSTFWSAFGLVMALDVLLVPMFAPYNQVLLLPALLILVRDIHQLWEGKRSTRFVCAITGLALFWPWVACAGLALATLALPASAVQSGWKLPFITTFTLPVLVFGLISLYVAEVRRRQQNGEPEL